MSDENNTVEELVKDISDRLESIGQASSAENVRAMVKESFEGLLNDQEFARKM